MPPPLLTVFSASLTKIKGNNIYHLKSFDENFVHLLCLEEDGGEDEGGTRGPDQLQHPAPTLSGAGVNQWWKYRWAHGSIASYCRIQKDPLSRAMASPTSVKDLK